MPILLNNSTGHSLLSIIADQIKLVDKDSCWIFYAMTCYCKQEASETLLKKLQEIIGNKLSGFHLLIDKDEYFKESLYLDSFMVNLRGIIQPPIKDISLTPICGRNNRLFHAKSYALINSDHKTSDNYEGFAIVTSANLTNAGLGRNLEIAHIFDTNDSLRQLYDIFCNLKNNYTLSQEELSKDKEFHQAFNFLLSGSFYHQWQQKHLVDLRFRLKLSDEEKKKRRDITGKPERDLGYDSDQENESFSKDPIDVESFFEKFPKPIPDKLLGRYSIDTLLGRWVPSKISDLLENELNKMSDIYIALLQNNIDEKMDQYLKELEYDVEDLKHRKIIDLADENNLNAISRWKKRVKQISKDKNLLKLLLWDYEIIPLSLDSIQEHNLIFSLYERVKELYNRNINRQGVGQVISENNHEQINNDFFEDLARQVEIKLKNNRLEDLRQKNIQGKTFCAILKQDKQIIIINGVFLEKTSLDKFIFYKNIDNEEEKFCLIENLLTFKIIDD